MTVTLEDPPATGVDKSGERVRAMFASIAKRYDFLNHFLSLNIDKHWRKFTIEKLRPRRTDRVLDCCTGTGDLAIAFVKAMSGGDREAGGRVVGADFCREMLVIGKAKAGRKLGRQAPEFVEADAQALPFASDSFDIVAVAFGLRNVANTVTGIDEMVRVAAPGGRVAILEFSRPKGRLLGGAYLAFFRRILPKVGQAIAPNSYNAYGYLPASVLEFPDGEAMSSLLESRGLRNVERRVLTLGVASLYVGEKTGRPSS